MNETINDIKIELMMSTAFLEGQKIEDLSNPRGC